MATHRSASRSFAIVLSLSVAAILVAAPQAVHAKPTDDQKGRAAIAAFAGYAAHLKIKDQDSSTLEGQLAIGFLKGLRNGAVDGAIGNLFPTITQSEKETIRGLIVQSFDGNRRCRDACA